MVVSQFIGLASLLPSRHNHGEERGCGQIKILPSKWKLPFGIEKLANVLEADRNRRLPVLSLEDHERYGDTYGQYSGGLFTILTRDARNISSLLSEQFPKFGYGHLRELCFGPLLGQSIFTEDGVEWSASRRLLASEFTSQHRVESSINLRPLFYDYTLDTATDLFLGNSTDILSLPFKAKNEGTRFSHAFNEALQWLATRERFKSFAWLVTTPGLLRSCSIARDSLETMIIDAQRMERRYGHSTFTDFLGRATDIGKARDELMSLLFAARDSNASLLCWLIYALAREPAVLEKVQHEVLSLLGIDSDVLPTDSDLTNMRYLDDVIQETLRLFPVVPINGRLCRETTTLPSGGGDSGNEPILVPKGTLVCFSTYACQRSTKYYGDYATKFRPERWQEFNIQSRTKDFTFHPFIGGPRKCLGGDSHVVNNVTLPGLLTH
ncbi:hypothetical protein S40288_08299 [Stachybotrys chartarum IBT 40288]|nr:hypothetical protein S40288_08299 [Stachybotrys chartarum IBT 40288]